MSRLTWGDVMIAAASASSAIGPDKVVELPRLIADIRAILRVTGTALEARRSLSAQHGEDGE